MPVKKVTSNKVQVTSKKQSIIASVAKQSATKKISAKIATSPSAPRNDKFSIPVYSLVGKEIGKMSLPKEIFGQKVNNKLLTQAVRVYMTNEKSLAGSTKTRGEVKGSTAKIYRQKGTGRARHGAIRAPIFVGGGIVFGPKPRNVRLELPKKMKKAALFSALSYKLSDKNLVGISGLEKSNGKTKQIAQLLTKIATKDKKMKSALIVTDDRNDNVLRAIANIPQATALSVNLINMYEVLKHELLMITKEAVDTLSGKGKVKST